MLHWYKIQIEVKDGDGWRVIHEVPFESKEFNDDFERFIDKQLEGLYGIDRMVIYYDTAKMLKQMEALKR
jgi:hypothetical protein